MYLRTETPPPSNFKMESPSSTGVPVLRMWLIWEAVPPVNILTGHIELKNYLPQKEKWKIHEILKAWWMWRVQLIMHKAYFLYYLIRICVRSLRL